MDVWKPDPDDIDPYGWFRPLLTFSRRLREMGVCWPVFVDEFDIEGGVHRRQRPDIYMYRHRQTGRFINTDHDGQAYRYVPVRQGNQTGRFIKIRPVAAVWRAGIPHHTDFVIDDRHVAPHRDDASAAPRLLHAPQFSGGPGDRWSVSPN